MTRTRSQPPLPSLPPLWSRLPEQIRRQLAAQLVPALRLQLRGRGEGDADAEHPVCK
jgi:hypothetical protein